VLSPAAASYCYCKSKLLFSSATGGRPATRRGSQSEEKGAGVEPGRNIPRGGEDCGTGVEPGRSTTVSLTVTKNSSPARPAKGRRLGGGEE
jgi:hypothetical protein